MSNNGTEIMESVQDPKAKKVLDALSDPAWDFRTIAGISKSSGLSESEVTEILNRHGNLIRKSNVPASDGSGLFTLRTRKVSAQERLAEVRMFITKSIR